MRQSAYSELAKSGIVFLVGFSAVGGFIAGQPVGRPFQWLDFFTTVVGVVVLSAGSAALNQIQERELDKKMPRTARRPLPSGRIPLRSAILFAGTTLVAGEALLLWVGWKTALLGSLAVLTYNGLYTLWWKRRWAFAAVPGAIPGALPVLIGATGAAGSILTPVGIYLFCVQFMWQMPHFWVLAIRFREDYRRGGFPTLPVARGSEIARSHIVLWSLAYVAILLLGPLFLKTSLLYGAVIVAISGVLLWELRRYFVSRAEKSWLRFFLWVNFSLIIVMTAAAIDRWSSYLLLPFVR